MSKLSFTIFALAAAALGAAPASAQFNNANVTGIHATYTATRTLPVAEIKANFAQSEHVNLDDPASTPGGRGQVLLDAFKAAGMTVSEWTTNVGPGNFPGNQNQVPNQIGAPGSAQVDVIRNYAFTITGFKRVEDVIAVIAKNGIRQPGQMILRPANWETLQDDLANEAVDGAVAKARKIAAHLGKGQADVLDVNVSAAPIQSGLLTTNAMPSGVTWSTTANVVVGIPAHNKPKASE